MPLAASSDNSPKVRPLSAGLDLERCTKPVPLRSHHHSLSFGADWVLAATFTSSQHQSAGLRQQTTLRSVEAPADRDTIPAVCKKRPKRRRYVKSFSQLDNVSAQRLAIDKVAKAFKQLLPFLSRFLPPDCPPRHLFIGRRAVAPPTPDSPGREAGN
jgi:hypothetical protein